MNALQEAGVGGYDIVLLEDLVRHLVPRVRARHPRNHKYGAGR